MRKGGGSRASPHGVSLPQQPFTQWRIMSGHGVWAAAVQSGPRGRRNWKAVSWVFGCGLRGYAQARLQPHACCGYDWLHTSWLCRPRRVCVSGG